MTTEQANKAIELLTQIERNLHSIQFTTFVMFIGIAFLLLLTARIR